MARVPAPQAQLSPEEVATVLHQNAQHAARMLRDLAASIEGGTLGWWDCALENRIEDVESMGVSFPRATGHHSLTIEWGPYPPPQRKGR